MTTPKSNQPVYAQLLDSVVPINQVSRSSGKHVNEMGASEKERFLQRSAMSQTATQRRNIRHEIFMDMIEGLFDKGYSRQDLARLFCLQPPGQQSAVDRSAVGKMKNRFHRSGQNNGKPSGLASRSEVLLAFCLAQMADSGIDLRDIGFSNEGQPKLMGGDLNSPGKLAH